MTKIVRKVFGGGVIAFWLNASGELCGWYEMPEVRTAETEADGGWPAQVFHAKLVGTTLAALRDELTEEGKDGGR